ncbi:hypothetical protein [Micromonospora arborensis]|uniref:hypothetical protein n=1 Tax=Micromonospora arborensis TaxID=2116518 RepID=UPI00371DDA16
MKRGSGLNPISAKRRAALDAAGVPVTSTFAARSPLAAGAPLQRTAAMRRTGARALRTSAGVSRRPKYTGPTPEVRALVGARCADRCEWPGCHRPAVDVHHRLNRKNGGRHGAARERINQAGWLLGACRHHHNRVTNPVGETRTEVERMGWLLREHQDALTTPVLTRHRPGPVLLDNRGGWRPEPAPRAMAG